MSFLNLFKPYDAEGLKISFGAELEVFKSLGAAGKEQQLKRLSESSDLLKRKSLAIQTQALKVISGAVVYSLTSVGTAILVKASLMLVAPLAALVLGVGLVAGRALFKKASSLLEAANLRDHLHTQCEQFSVKSLNTSAPLEIKQDTFD